MAKQIQRFTTTSGKRDPRAVARKLNDNFDATLGFIVGDGLIEASQVGRNVHLRLRVQNLLPLIPKVIGGALIKITGSASGGGKYTGVLWDRPTANIPATGNLTEAELGVSGAAIRIVNSREVGKNTHDLETSGYLPLIFSAVFLKTADDGVPVYMIDGDQWEDCVEP